MTIALMLTLLIPWAITAKSTTGLINPDGVFVLTNLMVIGGSATLINPQDQVESTYWTVLVIFFSTYLIASTLGRLGAPSQPTRVQSSVVSRSGVLIALYVASVAISGAYYLAAGGVPLLQGTQAALSGSSFDTQSARLETYAGAGYLYPGYVNQFKNAILPILTLAFIHRLWVEKLTGRLPLTLVMTAIMVICVAGTGQRQAIMLVLAIGVIAAWRGRVLRASTLVWVAAGGFAVFSLLTLLLNRQEDDLAAASGISGKAGVFANSLARRVFLEQADSGISAFHYTYPRPIQWGSEWATDILGVLPGMRGSDLANQVFAMLWGTPRGTAPASLWGGLHYNFGIALGVFVVLVLAMIFRALTMKLVYAPRSENDTFLRDLAFAGMTIAAGTWVSGSPLTILNQGFFAYLFLYWLSRRTGAPGQANADIGTAAGIKSR